jgi:glycosyltransferase involved in cell wall biosynthesis
VLRLCSVFEPPPEALARPDAAAYDPIGGMQNHTAELTRGLDRLGVQQHVLTSRLGAQRSRTRLGRAATVVRTGAPLRAARQLWAVDAARELVRLRGLGLVHAHQGEDLAVLPLAELVARRAGVPLVVTLHCSLSRTVEARRGRPLSVLGPSVERSVVRRADAVLVLTEPAAQAAVEDGVDPARVHVVPSGFDPAAVRRPVRRPDPARAAPAGAVRRAPGRPEATARRRRGPRPHGVPRSTSSWSATVPCGRRCRPRWPPRRPATACTWWASCRTSRSGAPAARGRLRPAVAVRGARAACSSRRWRAACRWCEPRRRHPGPRPRRRDRPARERGDVAGLAAALSAALTDRRTTRRTSEAARAHVDTAYSWPVLAERVHDVYVDVQRR